MRRCTSLEKKVFLNPGETIKLYNLSAVKFYRLIKEEQPFIVYYKTRKLIVRKDFEKFLELPEMMERLKKELPANPEFRRKCDKRA